MYYTQDTKPPLPIFRADETFPRPHFLWCSPLCSRKKSALHVAAGGVLYCVLMDFIGLSVHTNCIPAASQRGSVSHTYPVRVCLLALLQYKICCLDVFACNGNGNSSGIFLSGIPAIFYRTSMYSTVCRSLTLVYTVPVDERYIKVVGERCISYTHTCWRASYCTW